MIDVESYCRDIEAYLCRKNDGHLIRITGPAFEQVQGWAGQGVPLKVAGNLDAPTATPTGIALPGSKTASEVAGKIGSGIKGLFGK